MYHYDRHDSDAVHEDDDFRNRLCSSPVEDLGDWRKIMSLHCSTIISVRGSIILEVYDEHGVLTRTGMS